MSDIEDNVIYITDINELPEEFREVYQKMLDNMDTTPIEIQKIIDEHFWELCEI